MNRYLKKYRGILINHEMFEINRREIVIDTTKNLVCILLNSAMQNIPHPTSFIFLNSFLTHPTAESWLITFYPQKSILKFN